MPIPLLDQYTKHMGTIRAQSTLAMAQASILGSGNLPEETHKSAWAELIKEARGGRKPPVAKFKDKGQAKMILASMGVEFVN